MWFLETRPQPSHLIVNDPVTNQPFSAEWCQRVIDLASPLPAADAKVGADHRVDPECRTSTVRWIHPGEDNGWLYRQLTDIVNAINREFWQFDLAYIEALQFTKYGKDDHYDLHLDDQSRGLPDCRKLSFSIVLNEGFRNGDFVIQQGNKPNFIELKRGQMLLFPSFLLHGVRPVTKGTRFSLVGWVHGPAWR